MTGNNRSAAAGRKAKALKSPQPQPQKQTSSRKRNKRSRNVGGIMQSLTALSLMESGSNVRPMNNGFCRLHGSDYLGELKVNKSSPTAASRILKTFSVSPSAFPGTRLTQLSDLWERFRFRKFRVRYVPAVPNTLGCQLICYQDTDPQDDPTVISDPDGLIRQATAQTGSQQWNFNKSKVIHLAQRGDNQLYYTGPVKENPRFNQQAVIYVIQVTDPVNFNGDQISSETLTAGSLYIDWEIDFQTPQVNPGVLTRREAPGSRTASFSSWLKNGDTFTVPAGHRLFLAECVVADNYEGGMVELLQSGHTPIVFLESTNVGPNQTYSAHYRLGQPTDVTYTTRFSGEGSEARFFWTNTIPSAKTSDASRPTGPTRHPTNPSIEFDDGFC